tara:strand:- start:18376 stop:18750 length:375 start_codon:yes stop_codon:yes gene_type:complete
MNVYKSIFPPLLAPALIIGHSDAALAGPYDMQSKMDASASTINSDGQNETCVARSFGPAHHGHKRIRASKCTDKQQETRASVLQNCLISSRGPRHATLNSKRSDCAKGDGPVYSDAGLANEGGQ